MEIYIKNMVCNRCIMAVENIFKNLEIPYSKIQLGEVEIPLQLSSEKYSLLSVELISLGFELIDSRKSRIIEQVKNTIIKLINHSEENPEINISTYLSTQLNYEYKYLSSLFSEIEGITIEKYYIIQKIEKVKELLVYDELTISQIADKLGYSSAAYLNNQFKKHTGLTPGHFKKVKDKKRYPLDKL